MIDIKIGKIIEYNCGNCFGIEDLEINNTDLPEQDNYMSYSGSTRESFLEKEEIKNILKKGEYIRIEKVIDDLRKIEHTIPRYGDGKCLWKWFMFYCEKSLELYGEDAFIHHTSILTPDMEIYG